MEYDFKPRGVCSSNIHFVISDGKLYDLKFTGGCDGNLKAIGRLVEGQDAKRVAAILRGNLCHNKGTSCADQFSKAIDQAIGD